jgi:hypothetical protein
MYQNVNAESVLNKMAKWFAVRPYDSVDDGKGGCRWVIGSK